MTADHTKYTFSSGRKMQVLNEHVLVQVDPHEETVQSGLIFKPSTKACETIYHTGTILAFGYIRSVPKEHGKQKMLKEPVPIPDLEVGHKCCFVRFREHQHSNEYIQFHLGDSAILLKPADLLFTYAPGDGPDSII